MLDPFLSLVLSFSCIYVAILTPLCVVRCRWYGAAKRAGTAAAIVTVDQIWSDDDEAALKRAISNAAAGCMYIKLK